jgi:hypothetical protein
MVVEGESVRERERERERRANEFVLRRLCVILLVTLNPWPVVQILCKKVPKFGDGRPRCARAKCRGP